MLDQACPYYISIGMSYWDYWDGDPIMTKYYREADVLARKRDNYRAWMQGAYVYEAVGNLAPALKAFAKGSPKPYRNEVMPFTVEERREQEERKERAQYEANRELMKGWMESVNAGIRKKKEAENGSRTGGTELSN